MEVQKSTREFSLGLALSYAVTLTQYLFWSLPRETFLICMTSYYEHYLIALRRKICGGGPKVFPNVDKHCTLFVLIDICPVKSELLTWSSVY